MDCQEKKNTTSIPTKKKIDFAIFNKNHDAKNLGSGGSSIFSYTWLVTSNFFFYITEIRGRTITQNNKYVGRYVDLLNGHMVTIVNVGFSLHIT